MKPNNILSLVVAVGSGLVTLGLMFILQLDPAGGNPLAFVLSTILNWATTLAAAALLTGILNLISVHLRKASDLNVSSFYSIIFCLAFFGVIAMWAIAAAARTFLQDGNLLRSQMVGWSQNTVDFAFKYIQTPVEASLTGVLAVVMVLAGARLIRNHKHWSAFLFVLVALALIVGLAPIAGLDILSTLRGGLSDYLAVGAARGILLSISLGVIATGLRVIVGVDQPYGE